MVKVFTVGGYTESPEGIKIGDHKTFGTVIVEAEDAGEAIKKAEKEGIQKPHVINWHEKPSKPKPLFDNLPSRKEMNEERFKELVTELSEYKASEGGELAIMGRLFYQMYSDLSATQQEQYNRLLSHDLKKHKEKAKKVVCNKCGWLEIPGKQDPIEENGKAYCPVCDNVIRKAKGGNE